MVWHIVVDGGADHPNVSNAGVPEVILSLSLCAPMQVHLRSF